MLRTSVPILLLVGCLLLGVAQAATCPCHCPQDDVCPGTCARCVNETVSCACDTLCNATACPSGYGEINQCTACCQGSDVQRTCQRQSCPVRITSQCAECEPLHYGASCSSCPGIIGSGPSAQACNGRGTCNDGVSGSGLCTCTDPSQAAGPACEYTRSGTCHGRGTPTSFGGCTCDCVNEQYCFDGPFCEFCKTTATTADGYYGPSCEYCTGSMCNSANGGGVCNTGRSASEPSLCRCGIQYNGTNCLQCSEGFSETSPGICNPCSKDGTGRDIGVQGYGCNGHGLCNASAICECFDNHVFTASGNCDKCVPGYYANGGTLNCTACPGGAATPCSNKGTCAEGYEGTGACSCGNTTVNSRVVNYVGTDCNDPFIDTFTPTTAPAQGGDVLTLHGVSFGTGGTVEFRRSGAALSCPSIAWTETKIFCVIPQGGGGDWAVTVSRGGREHAKTFAYAIPSIAKITPSNAPIAGGTTITIEGSGLLASGTSNGITTTGQALFGGASGTIVAVTPLSFGDKVTFPLPQMSPTAFTGRYTVAYRLITSNGGYVTDSNTVNFDYDPPRLDSIAPTNGGVHGNYDIELRGLNFLAPLDVKIGGVDCPVRESTKTNTAVNCTVPAGVGPSKTVVASYKGGFDFAAPTTSAVFSYDGPELVAVRGCSQFNPSTGVTSDCPVGGDLSIQLVGRNFASGAGLSVTVDGKPCNGLTFTTTVKVNGLDTMNCTLPSGSRDNRPVVVTDSFSRQSSGSFVSYRGPTMTPGSLRFFNYSAGTGTGHIVANDTAGGQVVVIDGQFTLTGNLLVVYGYPRSAAATFAVDPSAGLYNCSVLFTGPVRSNTTQVACVLSAGVGAGLVFQVFVDGVPSQIGTDTLSYPAPVILPNTLRFPGQNKTSSLQANTQRGEVVEFDGLNFGPNPTSSLLTITYGPITDLTQFVCALQSASSGTIQCKTGFGFAQRDLRFRVSVGILAAPSTVQSVVGSDAYNYPNTPAVTRVVGCPVTTGLGTANCPTQNPTGIQLSITGEHFVAGQTTVRVGENDCPVVSGTITSNALNCTLPEGAGQPVSVVVSVALGQDTFVSQAAALVSFSTPTVSTITSSSCATSGNSVVNCPRVGGAVLQLTGQNFGASDAKVIVGGTECTPLYHNHEFLNCTLAAGIGISRTVIIVQGGCGVLTTSNVTVSYQQCPPGFFYRGLETICRACEVGSFASTQGQTSCLKCDVGFYAPGSNHTACPQCPPGRFGNATGLGFCYSCPPGRFGAVPAASSCLECGVGRFQGVHTQTTCSVCQAGFFADTSGSQQCAPCAPGKFTTSLAQSSCVDCSAGEASPASNATSCSSCPAGKFSLKGSPNCGACLPGFFSGSAGLSTCTACSAGSYNGISNSTACTRCIPGRAQGLPGQSVCAQCAAGRFMEVSGAQECLECPAGSISASPEARSCAPCALGSVQASAGQSFCVTCAAGRVASAAATSCDRCDAGRFTNRSSQTVCTACAAGYASSVSAATACLKCDLGRFSSSAAAVVCASCPVGKFQSVRGQSFCANCAAGYVAVQEGTGTCTGCLPGFFQEQPGGSDCPTCSAGRYSNTHNATVCQLCRIGRYARLPQHQATDCVPCAAGFFSLTEGSAECSPCTSGRFAGATGTTQCSECGVGKYSTYVPAVDPSFTNPGPTACVNCTAGRFLEKSGFSQCRSCQPGTFQDSSGRSFCAQCPKGHFQSEESRTTCQPCELGRFSSDVGATSCTLCGPGFFTNITGSLGCERCAKGRFQAGNSPLNCSACAPGFFTSETALSSCQACAAGRIQNIAGQESCIGCAEGKYQTSLGTTQCIDCGVGAFGLGTFQDLTGKSVCKLCPSGRFTNGTGVSDCFLCAAGSFQDLPGQTACKLCTPGTAQASEGQNSCPACLGLNVAPYSGLRACVSCGEQAVASELRDQCLCNPGFYDAQLPVVNDGVIHCSPCPEGADCTQSGTTFSNMQVLPGWWRASPTSLVFYRCLLPQHCDGGHFATCAPHREGPLCAVCEDGFRAATGASACKQCPKKSQSFGVSVVLTLLVIFALCVMYWIVLRTDQNLVEEDRVLTMAKSSWHNYDTHLQRAVAASYDNIGITSHTSSVAMPSPSEDDLSYEDEDSDNDDMEATMDASPVVLLKSRTQPNFTFKLKILVGFFQIATNLAFQVDIPWPSYYQSFITFFKFFSLDFVPWQSVGCVALLNYYDKILVVTITPLVILLFLMLFYLLPLYVLELRDMSDENIRRATRKRARRKFWKLVLFTIFLMYPNVSSTVLGMFVCKKVEGTWYVLDDFNLQCFTDQWYNYLYPAIFMTILYPIGIPTIFLYMLHRYRRRLHEPGVRVQLGFLYEAYSAEMWYFEIIDMIHKLTLTSLLSFWPLQLQMPFAMVFVTAYTTTVLLTRPYIRKADDRLHLLAQAELFLFVLAGYVLLREETRDGKLDFDTDVAMSVVLIAVTCVLMLVFAGMVVKNLRKLYRLQRRNARLKRYRKAQRVATAGDELQLTVQQGKGGKLELANDGVTVGVVERGTAEVSDFEVLVRTPGQNEELDPTVAASKRKSTAASVSRFHLNPMFIDKLSGSTPGGPTPGQPTVAAPAVPGSRQAQARARQSARASQAAGNHKRRQSFMKNGQPDVPPNVTARSYGGPEDFLSNDQPASDSD